MNDINKVRRISIILGIAFILASALTVVLAAKTTHYTASITGITSTSRTHGKNGRTKYHERVSVTYKDNAGSEHTANNIHLSSTVESTLPGVGDNIEVMGKIWVREYSVTTYFAFVIVFLIIGIILLTNTKKRIQKFMSKNNSSGTGAEVIENGDDQKE